MLSSSPQKSTNFPSLVRRKKTSSTSMRLCVWGLAQELPQVRPRAAEASRHGVSLRDQLHDLLVPVGEGPSELGEQFFHGHILCARVDGLDQAPYHSLVLLRHALRPPLGRGWLHCAPVLFSLTGGVGWSGC